MRIHALLITLLASLWAESTRAGTNLVRRIVQDDPNQDGKLEMYAEKFLHGTNVVIEISLVETERGKVATVLSRGGNYVIAHTDRDGDGVFESIMISLADGDILEVLKRDADGKYQPAPQDDLDEMNRITRKIDALLHEKSSSSPPP